MAKRPTKPRRDPGAAALVAEEVQNARKRAKLSQVELAERIGTGQRGITRLESGSHNATIGTLERVAAATGSDLLVRLRPRKAARRAPKKPG